MAIEFNCPHCHFQYRLKDELAGKTATCKNCREKIVIPQPVTIPDDAAPLSPEEIAAREAAALAALNDEPAQEDVSKKIIDVECPHCNTKWTEPIDRAGKNTLCKNPECKARVKIPEPKDEGQYDWRHRKTKAPEGAKQNNEKLEGVVDAAADAKMVTGQSLKEADATGEELEPIPFKRKAMFALLGLGLVASLVFGVMYMLRSRTEGKEDRLIGEATQELAGAQESLPKDELPLFNAVMHMAAGEHALRHDTKDKLKEAREQFGRAREALRPPGTSPARNALCAELAVAYLALGGTEQQARDGVRVRWLPDTNLRARPNERVITVYEELQTVLGLVAAADPEFRTHLARRLTRELARRGQPGLALDLLPLVLFNQQEQAEGKAVVALELHRAKEADLARRAAEELKLRGAELGKTTPQPASAATLFLVLGVDKPPTIVTPPPAPNTPILDGTRYAYTGLYVLEGKPDEALAVARRDGRPEQQVRALTLCADWSPDPGPALDTAFGVLSANKGKKDASVSPYAILRLSQIAAAGGKHEQAKQFADLLPDDSARAWARGDAVRLRLAAAPTQKGDEAWAELPDDAKKYRAGNAWARLWVARQNARLSGNRADEAKAVTAWPNPISAFGKAGVALGLQDREKDK